MRTHKHTHASQQIPITMQVSYILIVGPDVLVWNLHRRYGHHRLPLLLKGWEQVAVYGWREELLEAPAPFTITYEPVLVLRHTQNKK